LIGRSGGGWQLFLLLFLLLLFLARGIGIEKVLLERPVLCELLQRCTPRVQPVRRWREDRSRRGMLLSHDHGSGRQWWWRCIAAAMGGQQRRPTGTIVELGQFLLQLFQAQPVGGIATFVVHLQVS